MNKNNSVLISFHTWDELKDFAKEVTKFTSDVNVYNESNYYDAKSIMALFALSLSKPRYVEIVSSDIDEINNFKSVMGKFETKE